MSTDEALPEETITTVIAPASATPPAAAPLPEPPKNITARNPLCTVGRRKSAQARVRIHPGEGKVTVNGRSLEQYFSLETDRTTAVRPFALTGALKKYDLSVKVTGGGATGQAAATALGVGRA